MLLQLDSVPFAAGTPPNKATEKENNQPHIVLFKDDDDEGVTNQYFISIEQQLMLESSNVVSAVFLCVASHYIFNLSYHRKSGKIWLFIQEKILRLQSKLGLKRHPSTVCHFSGIQRVFDTQEDG